MINQEDLIAAFARNVMLIKKQTAGLTDEDCLLQPPPRGNCMNWVIGHILAGRDKVLDLLGEPAVMGADGIRYEYDSAPLTGAEPRALPLEELLARLDRTQEGIVAGLSRLTGEDLARLRGTNENARTLGQWLFFRYFHETYHAGQTEFLRQLAGTNDRVI